MATATGRRGQAERGLRQRRAPASTAPTPPPAAEARIPQAYHKITHAGLGRCGMAGPGDVPGAACVRTLDAAGDVLHERRAARPSALPGARAAPRRAPRGAALARRQWEPVARADGPAASKKKTTTTDAGG